MLSEVCGMSFLYLYTAHGTGFLILLPKTTRNTNDNNDQTMSAPRKLTDAESSTLRSLLLKQLNVSGSQAEEDAGDLLDYAFAMIANGKDVDYVVDEVRFLLLLTLFDLCCGLG